MAAFENQKLLTEKFIEDAVNGENIDTIQEEIEDVSEKLILDEISNRKTKKIEVSKPDDVNDSLPEFCPLESTDKSELLENILEKTESSRDLSTFEDEGLKEESNENEKKEDLEETEVQIDVEAKRKDEWQDILGSGVIMKKILKEGEPDSRPRRSEKCLINYTCRLEDADEETFVEKGESYEIGLGEGDVVQGLDVAIGLMNKKERCLLKIGSRLAYGEKGLPPNIPGDATVTFDVELADVQSEYDFDTMSIQERRRVGNKKRERGNWWYQRGENTLAIQCYRRALDFLDEVENENSQEKPSDSELQQLLEDRLKVLNNMASAQIKMELFDQAQMSLQAVLKCQPDNVKALFRKAKIYIAKNDLNNALKMLEKAKCLEPDDPLITKEIALVNGLINKQKNSEREYARRMFGGAPTSGSNSKTKVAGGGKKSRGGKIQLWATIGVTIIVGLAGVVAYKFKYP